MRHVDFPTPGKLIDISIHAPRVGCDIRGVDKFTIKSGFQSTHPVWGATWVTSEVLPSIRFQSTHPVWGATPVLSKEIAAKIISIHAPRVGCDRGQRLQGGAHADFNPRTPCGVRRDMGGGPGRKPRDFNPRTPCGVRRANPPSSPNWAVFQSTHPVWGATPRQCIFIGTTNISIHAPRVGCDFGLYVPPGVLLISIHAPRVGCDIRTQGTVPEVVTFQSTHPVWGATQGDRRQTTGRSDFNPRTPCGVRLPFRRSTVSEPPYFNPRTPCGVRPDTFDKVPSDVHISIHAPRVGCDSSFAFWILSASEFQSTHPVWGATRYSAHSFMPIRAFQSTHPVWGATPSRRQRSAESRHFNPRTPCGVRPPCALIVQGAIHFNPRTPCGVRLYGGKIWDAIILISIHAPRVGCDFHLPPRSSLRWISIHAPRVGCDVGLFAASFLGGVISIHAPRVGCDFLSYPRGTSDH